MKLNASFISFTLLVLSAGVGCAPGFDPDSPDSEVGPKPLVNPTVVARPVAPSPSPSHSPSPVPLRPTVSVFRLGMEGDQPSLSNRLQGGSNLRDTGISVVKGDKIEIRPACLFKERRKVPDPKVVRVDNEVCIRNSEVCVSNEPVFERRCTEKCRVCVKCQALPPACFPWRCCDDVCQDVQVGERCTRSEQRCAQRENQWKELTSFGELGAPESVKECTPMAHPRLLLESLKLRFVMASGIEVSCPLARFSPEVDSEKISLWIRNVDGCDSVFSQESEEAVALGIVNEMSEPLHYLQGVQVKTWDGRVVEKPVEATYFPEISFQGSLTVRSLGARK